MIEKKKDYSISFVRLIATMFIVTCHIMQYFDCVLAWWFNVGVQMFLFISGYLYGRKEHIDIVCFYSKNYKKLLTDFYIYAIIIIGVIFITGKIQLSELTTIQFLLFKTFPAGLEHFWFIPCIIICYGLTPILLAVVKKIDETDGIKFVTYCFSLLVVVDIVFHSFVTYSNSAWINCFIIGMLLIRCEQKKVWKSVKIMLFALCVVMNGVQIYISYFTDIHFEGLYYQIYNQWCNYAHILLGITIVYILRWIYTTAKLSNRFVAQLLDWSDVYSYDIYIVHQFFILGPHSVLAVHESNIIGILTAVSLSVISVQISPERCEPFASGGVSISV